MIQQQISFFVAVSCLHPSSVLSVCQLYTFYALRCGIFKFILSSSQIELLITMVQYHHLILKTARSPCGTTF